MVVSCAPVAQSDRASAFEVDANSIQVVAPVALTSSEPSSCCSKFAPKNRLADDYSRSFSMHRLEECVMNAVD